jgi:hypothetical protein
MPVYWVNTILVIVFSCTTSINITHSLEEWFGNTPLDRSDHSYRSSAEFGYNFDRSISRISVARWLHLSSRLMISTPQSPKRKHLINSISMAHVMNTFAVFLDTTVLTEESLGDMWIVSLALVIVCIAIYQEASSHAYQSSMSHDILLTIW